MTTVSSDNITNFNFTVCNNRSATSLCIEIDVSTICSECFIAEFNTSSFFYSCPCSVPRSNPCPGLGDSAVCSVDFCSNNASLCPMGTSCVSRSEGADCLCKPGLSVLATTRGLDCVFVSTTPVDPNSDFFWWYFFLILTTLLLLALITFIFLLKNHKLFKPGGNAPTSKNSNGGAEMQSVHATTVQRPPASRLQVLAFQDTVSVVSFQDAEQMTSFRKSLSDSETSQDTSSSEH